MSAAGRLIVVTGEPADPDVTELLRAAEAAGYEHRLAEPTTQEWNVADPAVEALIERLGPSDTPLDLAGHGRGVFAAFGTYRDLGQVVAIVGLRGSASMAAGSVRLLIGADEDDVFSTAREWFAKLAHWHGPDPPADADVADALARGGPDAAPLLTDVATFHRSNAFVEKCCIEAAGAADPYLRSTAVVCIGSILSDRWYGISDDAKRVVYDLQRDEELRAVNPRFERAIDDFWFNIAP